MGWRIALTTEAESDLEGIVRFLADKNPAAAERIGLELVALIFALPTFPRRGAPVRSHPRLRKVALRHYLVIYQVKAAARMLLVVRVWDARRDPGQLRLG